MKLEFHGNITWEEWLKDWFGYFYGREIGIPHRKFYSDPNILPRIVRECGEKKLPCYMTVQPYSKYNTPCAIEKLFFDFDYAHKNEFLTEEETIKRKRELEEEVKLFVERLSFDGRMIKPLIVKTRRGFHVYIFLDRIWNFKNIEFAKKVYTRLCNMFINRIESKYCDRQVLGNIKQLARVPLSIHEKSGEICYLVNEKLEQTKIRRISFYRKIYGLREDEILNVIEQVKRQIKEEEKRKIEKKFEIREWNIVKNEIRPCFKHALKVGEMSHQQRLALLLEAYYNGITSEDGIVKLFSSLHDFDENITRYQVKWFLRKIKNKTVKPYQCKTIYKYGWCLTDKCQYYKKVKINHMIKD